MTAQSDLLPHKVITERRDDGTLILTSGYKLGPVAANTGEWLHRWAAETPGTVFLAERRGDSWRELTYQDSLTAVRSLASALLGQGLIAGDRLIILSGNSVDHALLTLAAQYVGIVSFPVAEQYSLIPEAHDRLAYIATKTKPKMVFADDAARYAQALQLAPLANIPVITKDARGALRETLDIKILQQTPVTAAVDRAYAAITPDSLAKILFTSGSTAHPKGVCTTQRMMCVNQAQIGAVLPFLAARKHKIVDWLPWNHVFGGSHNFNMMLAFGGSFYIDNGKPAPGLFAKTLENLALQTGTLAFNVPVGWALLTEALKTDPALSKRFFTGLEMIFYAGAPLPQGVWADLQKLAMAELGHIPLMTSSWGMTETAPGTLLQHEPIARTGVIGVPVPEVAVKLIPDDAGRYELRVKGPNIMLEYYDAPEKTAEAFDNDGFLITEDAVRFLDPDNHSAGLVFDGRMSEDFKLMSGTWVQSANIRAKALAELSMLAQDVVVTGQGRTEIGLLIFPNPEALAAEAPGWTADNGALVGGDHGARIKTCLETLAKSATGSSTRISRALVLADPPSVKDHEVTAKGNLNIRRVLEGRAALVDRLYDNADPATIQI
jgi:feruloyl-CoA synthase